MNKYKIHFVCRGNIYRSRLAEAWAKTINSDQIAATSSGITAAIDNPGIELSSYAKYAAAQVKISDNLSEHKVQTTNATLAADIVVFMNRDVYQDAKATYLFNPASCLVWNIEDIGERLASAGKTLQDLNAIHQIAMDTTELIKTKTEQLITELTTVSWGDIVDEHNQELGFRLPISWANAQGLWRRSCHAVILTADNKYIVEKRSKSIVFSPGRLDVTLGGAVDDGELPEAAIIREVSEELGLHVTASMLELIEVYKWSSYHPHYQKYTRCFLYTYRIQLRSTNPSMRPQASEVAEIRLLSARQMGRLLRFHRLISFGRLNSGYKYYQRVIKRAYTNRVS